MRPLLLFAGLAFAAPAAAQTITVKPLAEARLRYEGVAQDGVPRDADAVTMRVRTGVQAAAGAWSVLVEAQANLAIVGDYYDGFTVSRRGRWSAIRRTSDCTAHSSSIAARR